MMIAVLLDFYACSSCSYRCCSMPPPPLVLGGSRSPRSPFFNSSSSVSEGAEEGFQEICPATRLLGHVSLCHLKWDTWESGPIARSKGARPHYCAPLALSCYWNILIRSPYTPDSIYLWGTIVLYRYLRWAQARLHICWSKLRDLMLTCCQGT